MDTLVITGGVPLRGEIHVGGAKNVAIKALAASILTDEELEITNVPDIADVHTMIELLEELGIEARLSGHTARLHNKGITSSVVPLDIGARLRSSVVVLGPLLARVGEAQIPNPGGCRIGARPIDRLVEGFKHLGVTIRYRSDDGFFHAKVKNLQGSTIRFAKNTHTGTEAMILAAVLAKGTTILENAAQEVEVDDLIGLLTSMGADIHRVKPRTIMIRGVKKLHGSSYRIMPDRNEEVTFAVAAAATGGDVVVHGSQPAALASFHDYFLRARGKLVEEGNGVTRYGRAGDPRATDVVTAPHPGFMTDWQAPWAVLMTQARGVSTIHETVFESRFSFVSELLKMGAHISFFDPPVENPRDFYNFNWSDHVKGSHQAIRITGPTVLHNAVMTVEDLRAGATLVLAAMVASGESYVHGVEHVDRGYEKIEERLRSLGARIRRISQ